MDPFSRNEGIMDNSAAKELNITNANMKRGATNREIGLLLNSSFW